MHAFIEQVKSRLNIAVALRSLMFSVIGVGCVCLVFALYYLWKGYAVAGWVFGVGVLSMLIAAAALWYLKRHSSREAAFYADDHFGLKDTIVSSIDLATKDEPGKYDALQLKQTEQKIEGLDSKDVPIALSKPLTFCAGGMCVALLSLSLIPTSKAVLDQQAYEEEVQKESRELQSQVKEQLEKMMEDLTAEEKALIDEDLVKKWLAELKPTRNDREAMLNVARAKQQIQQKLSLLENRKAEALVKAAGIKLQEAKNAKARDVGEAMKQKDFDAVKKALEEFKERKDKHDKEKGDPDLLDKIEELKEKLKNEEELTDEEREELLEELADRLDEIRELTKRMAEAALEQMGDSGEMFDGEMSDLPSDYQLDQLMEYLDRYAQEMQGEMQSELMDGESMTLEELLELLEGLEEMDEGLGYMQDMMGEMEARKLLSMRLRSLRSMLGGGSQGEGMLLGLAQKGGKQPGLGTDESRRNQRDEDLNNENYTKLKGQQGKGPVQKKVEAADSGFGTSNRKGAAKQRDFQHQMGSYMTRDDIPEDMKQAMREYYKDIHQVAEGEK